MNDVVLSIKQVTDIMGEITEASREQSQGIDQINQAITEMDNVTQQNAALVEEAAAAAGSLQEQAANLAEAVSIFKLNGSQVSKASAPRALPQTNVKMQAVKKATSQPRLVAKRAVALAKPSSTQEKADDWEEF